MIYPSKEIENLEFAALGNNQVEFFTSKQSAYFMVYNSNPDSMSRLLVNLNDSKVIELSNGYKIERGIRTHKVIISTRDSGSEVRIIGYLWGWLPYHSFKGSVSMKGLSVIEENLSKHSK